MYHLLAGISDSAFSIQYLPKCSHVTNTSDKLCRLLLVLDKNAPFKSQAPSFTEILLLSHTPSLKDHHFPALILTVNEELLLSQWKILGVSGNFSSICSCKPKKTLTKNQHDTLSFLFQKLSACPAGKTSAPGLLKYSWLYEILCTVQNIFQSDTGSASSPAKAGDTIDRIISYINENYMEQISVDKLSSEFYISKYHLMREFKKTAGCTIHTYLLNQRISHAQQMIAKGILAGTASSLVGFSDYSLFYRSFLKLTGTSPREYGSSFDDMPIAE